MERTVPISAILIGDRHRKDLGDIDALAASIEGVGLLQPVGITPSFELVFGERRLRAFERLGRSEIPARFVDVDQLVMGEFAENTLRKDFTVSERMAILRTIDRKPRGDQARSQNFATVDEAARIAGFGNRETARQAEEVVKAAETRPERFGDLLEEMDHTGRINSAYRKLKAARQAEEGLTRPSITPNVHEATRSRGSSPAQYAADRAPESEDQGKAVDTVKSAEASRVHDTIGTTEDEIKKQTKSLRRAWNKASPEAKVHFLRWVIEHQNSGDNVRAVLLKLLKKVFKEISGDDNQQLGGL